MIGAKKKFFGVALIYALGLVACGDDGSGTGAKDAEGTGEVSGVCHVPQCDESLEGIKVLSRDVGKVYQCKAGSWTDSLGKGFAEKDFVNCFLDAVVLDSVAKLGDLDGCTAKGEGSLAVVGENLVVCVSKKWTELSGHVVSEADLPECKKSGSLEYVLSKMAAYQCKDGLWYRDGKAVTPAQPESSSSVKSSASVEPSIDDGTKVRGMCIASEKVVAKGVEVKYSFYSLGGTAVSYSWNFGKNASVSASDEKSPKVSYKQGGIYKAKLVVNEGRASESDELECAKLTVTGTPVTGCTCTADADALVLRDASVSNKWTVSGCTGGAPFTYEWGDGASGTGASVTMSATEGGVLKPTVTIANSEGMTMEPECKEVPVTEPMHANCSIDGLDFMFDDMFTATYDKPSNKIGSLTMAVVSKKDGVNERMTIDAPYDSYCEQYMWYGVGPKTIRLPKKPSAFAYYSVVYAGDTLCTASPLSCGPSESFVEHGKSVTWQLKLAGEVYSAGTYDWLFTNYGGYEETSSAASPKMVHDKLGTIYATLKINEGTANERELTCSSVTVEYASITDCSCTPELVSGYDDLDDVDEVKYSWTVSGCKSYGTTEFSYNWDYDYAQDETDPNKATRSFSEKGAYSPVVQVVNRDGTEEYVRCAAGIVKKGGDYTITVDYANYQTLYAGKYAVTQCDDYQNGSSGTIEVYDYNDDVLDWFESDVDLEESYGDYAYLNVSYPLQLNIPDGRTITFGYCYEETPYSGGKF